MNHHGRQSCKKRLRLQEVFAGMGPLEEPCLLDGSPVVTVSETGRRGRGTGSLFYEKQLVTLNLVILITGKSRRGSTLVAYDDTMEVEQEHIRERTMLAQANVCMLEINTVRLGIKRCSPFLSQSSLEQLFKESKDDIKEAIFRRCFLSSKEEQRDMFTGEVKEQGLEIRISTAVLLSYNEEAAVYAYVCPCPHDLGSAESIQRGCSLHQLSLCTLLDSLQVTACPSFCCPLRIFTQVLYPSFASIFA